MPGFFNLKTTAALVALVTMSSAGAASAATVACTPTVSAALTTNIGCEVSTAASQDFTQSDPITVNAEAFFGNTDWVFESKDNLADNVKSGTLTISSLLWSSYSQVMAIFKSGNENSDNYLVGFLLSPDDTSFDYTSPFFNQNGKPKAISHISIYGRGDGDDGDTGGPVGAVPVPAGLPLLASALGIGLFLRRRRS